MIKPIPLDQHPQAEANLGNWISTYLCEQFSGTVFVLADHGQHPSTGEKLGEHGEFHHLDLTVPWISWEQSGYEEN